MPITDVNYAIAAKQEAEAASDAAANLVIDASAHRRASHVFDRLLLYVAAGAALLPALESAFDWRIFAFELSESGIVIAVAASFAISTLLIARSHFAIRDSESIYFLARSKNMSLASELVDARQDEAEMWSALERFEYNASSRTRPLGRRLREGSTLFERMASLSKPSPEGEDDSSEEGTRQPGRFARPARSQGEE